MHNVNERGIAVANNSMFEMCLNTFYRQIILHSVDDIVAKNLCSPSGHEHLPGVLKDAYQD